MLTIGRAKLVSLLLMMFCVFGSIAAQSPATEPELVRLRHQWAMRFLEPGPHMELAKYFCAKGNLIQAFYILENARRGRFEQKVFDDAFLLHFGGFRPLDNSKAEEEKYLSLRKSSPNNVVVIKRLADIYISRDDFTRAAPLLKLALERNPEDFSSVTAIAEIFRRQKTPDKAKQILVDFEREFPTAAGSYDLRIQRAMKDDAIAARSLLAEALKKYPSDGNFWYFAGILAEREDKIEEAERNYIKSAELEKDSVGIQGTAARFLRNKTNDKERALKYYLNAYILDPHAHIDGFAEARISSLNIEISKSRVEKLLGSGAKPEELLNDPNPMVVVMAMEKIAEKWDGKHVDLFVRMMRHDEVVVRWYAMRAIMIKEGRTFDVRLKELLKDGDLRVRGLAAYMAVRLWKNDSFHEMRNLLAENAQVLRFDAVSALIMEGGPDGRKIVIEHRKRERNESLRKLIDSVVTPAKH